MTQYVKKAQQMAHALVARETISGRDTGEAMRIASRKYGIPYNALWSLRYRAPKDIFASIYFAISSAHEAMCDQQRQKLEHELSVAKARGAHPDLLREVSALGGVHEPE
jgi:hypothetical protein